MEKIIFLQVHDVELKDVNKYFLINEKLLIRHYHFFSKKRMKIQIDKYLDLKDNKTSA